MRTAQSLICFVSLLFDLIQDAILFVLLGTRSSAALKAENIFLRKQLALYLERDMRPRRTSNATRLSLVLLSRLFTWRDALIIVKPRTFLGWHREGFRLLWRWKSRPRGRPRLPEKLQKLILQDGRGKSNVGRRTHRCGVAPQTGDPSVASDRPTLHADRNWARRRVPSQRWMTFVRNHARDFSL